MKICIDLTPNEMMDRHGGFGRYGIYLVEKLLQLPVEERRGIEFFALPWSDRPPVPAEDILDRNMLRLPAIPVWKHRWQRRLLTGALLHQFGIDLFHATHPIALPYATSCKLVASTHDIIPVVFPVHTRTCRARRDLAREKQKQWVRHMRPDHVVASSETTKQDLISVLQIPSERISVIHLGVDTGIFNSHVTEGESQRIREKYGLPERFFICVGSDHYRKNQRRLFDAWRSVSSSIDEGLVLVGRALYSKMFQEIQRESLVNGYADNFRWLQGIDDAELPALYRMATALIAPSMYEGFGLTLLEAMACGTPVAAAGGGSYQEVGGEDADYFDPQSTEQMSDCLVALSKKPAKRQKMRQQGLKRVKNFLWDGTAYATLALYRKLLGIDF
ncbi:MAG: glycosyltransferase family 1 protein [Pseudomonadota bacterium]